MPLIRLLFVASLTIPLGLDLYMPVPDENPLTPEKIELGRQLFNDRRLSRDGMIACVSCHDPSRAFSDGRVKPVGVFGRQGRRNAPALVNRGYGRAFFWDARTSSLEEQVLKPIEDPNEMDLPVEEAARRVSVSAPDLSRALASFVRSILSGDSAYDRFANGDRNALSAEQQAGLQIFRGRGNCTACHVGPNFTDERTHNTGIAWAGGAGRAGEAAGEFLDEGRAAISGKPDDRGAFKTPTLREVTRTAPYMHDGSLATLEDVIDYYDRGGNVNPLLDLEIRPLRLGDADKRALVAFLTSLTGAQGVGAEAMKPVPEPHQHVPLWDRLIGARALRRRARNCAAAARSSARMPDGRECTDACFALSPGSTLQ
jgi:cytochrome c peroxidase